MSSIPLPALAVKAPESPLNQYAQALSIKSLMGNQQLQAGQQQLQQLQIKQAKQQQQDSDTFRKAFQDNNGDFDKSIAAAVKAGISPQMVTQLQAHALDVKTKTAALTTDQLKNQATQNDNLVGLIKPIVDAPAEKKAALYQQSRQQLLQNPAMYGINDPSQIPPEQYPGDDAMKSQMALHQGGKQQAEQAIKEREVAAAETRAKNTGGVDMAVYNSLTNPQPPAPGAAASPNQVPQVPLSPQAQPPQVQPPSTQAPQVQPQQPIPIGMGGMPAITPESLMARSGISIDPQSGKLVRPNPGANVQPIPNAMPGQNQPQPIPNADPNNPAQMQPVVNKPLTPVEALAKINETKVEAKSPPLGADKVKQFNDGLTSRWHILHPNQPLPDAYTLPATATRKDYEDIDKSLEQHEKAVGTKAQQDTVNAIRSQTATMAQQAAEDRHATLGMQPVVGTDADGNRVLVSKSDADKMGLTGLSKADADLQNKSEAARHWLTLASKQGQTPETMGISQLIDKMDKENKLGVVTSRWNDFMAGKVGAGDPEFTALRAKMGLANTKLMQAHVGSRGGAFMLEHFEDLANAGKMNASTLKSAVNSEVDYMQDVAMLPKAKKTTQPKQTQPANNSGFDPAFTPINQ